MKIHIAFYWIMLIGLLLNINCIAQTIELNEVSAQDLAVEAKIFLAKNDQQRYDLVFEKIENLKAKGNYDEALTNIKRLDYENIDDKMQEKILAEGILLSLLADKKKDASFFATQYRNYVKDSNLFQQTIYLMPLVFLANEDWTNAYNSMISKADSLHKKSIDSSWAVLFPKFKRPKIAKIMSATIPGSGQIYDGAIGFGIINLLGVSGSTYFLVWHLIQHYYIIGAITGGGLFSRFYLGGLKTSIMKAEEKNDKKAATFKNQMSNWWLNFVMKK